MGGDWAIKVEGVGKEYRIAASRGGYTALRDVLAQNASRFARRLVGRGGADAPSHEPFWALKDVSFEVPRGECVGVIGRNGAGKSTLLKILSRITEPTTGEIRLRGRVGSLLEVGTGFHPELTGRENVFLNGAILGMSRAEIRKKFDEIVAFAEVEKFLDTPVKYYSSGMYTRLAFAVAAHLEPEILIVDEVLAVGDAEFQKKCLGKMGEVAKGGRTVLFVSHAIGTVQAICAQAIFLQGGRVVEFGPAHKVASLYLARGVGGESFERPPAGQPAALRSGRLRLGDSEGRPELELTLTIESLAAKLISVDVRLSDPLGSPVAFGPVGSFDQSCEIELTAGRTVVTCTHDLSLLANGTYDVSIDLAEPMRGYLDRAERCLRFDLDVPPAAGYRRLEQKWGLGSSELPYVRHTVAGAMPERAAAEQLS